ncbi:MAG: hypothetical protein KBC73_16475 [Burkholderiaceae bacterium]|nr:hypothetical protein [Burkholderiaceae bacterium]
MSSVRRELPTAEHLIVDGSDLPLLPNRGHPPNLVIRHGKDRGISHAFNRGILSANREYVIFINAGDYLIDGAGGAIQQALGGDKPDIAWFPVHRLEPDGSVTVYRPRLQWLKYAMSAPHQGMIVRRDVFAQVGLFTLQRYAMDHHFALRVVSARPAYRIDCHSTPIAVYPSGGHSTRGGYKPFLANCRNVWQISPRDWPAAVLANAYLVVKSKLAQVRVPQ